MPKIGLGARQLAPSATHYGWLAFGALVLTVYGSLLPFQFQPHSLDEGIDLFWEMTYYQPSLLEARGDWVVSLVLYMTLSYLAMAALCVDRAWEAGIGAAALVATACAILSLALEFTQVFFPPRTVSVNDVLVESLGGLAGTGVWLTVGQRISDWFRRVGTAQGIERLAGRLLPGYFALLLIVELMPFDLVVSGAELRAKYQEGKIWLLPFSNPKDRGMEWCAKALLNAAAFLPLGFLALVAARKSAEPRRPWLRVAVPGLAAAGLVEFLQLFAYSRYCDVTDVLTGAAGVLGGWYLGEVWLRQRSAGARQKTAGPLSPLWSAAFVAWVGVVLAVNWWPFDFTMEPARFATDSEDLDLYGLRRLTWLPFVDYYWGSKYHALDQFTRKALLFLPLGVLFALRRDLAWQRGVGTRVVIVSLLVAAAVQLGRYFLPARVPSVTDLLIESGAAWTGFALSRHVGTLLDNECSLQGTRREFCR